MKFFNNLPKAILLFCILAFAATIKTNAQVVTIGYQNIPVITGSAGTVKYLLDSLNTRYFISSQNGINEIKDSIKGYAGFDLGQIPNGASILDASVTLNGYTKSKQGYAFGSIWAELYDNVVGIDSNLYDLASGHGVQVANGHYNARQWGYFNLDTTFNNVQTVKAIPYGFNGLGLLQLAGSSKVMLGFNVGIDTFSYLFTNPSVNPAYNGLALSIQYKLSKPGTPGPAPIFIGGKHQSIKIKAGEQVILQNALSVSDVNTGYPITYHITKYPSGNLGAISSFDGSMIVSNGGVLKLPDNITYYLPLIKDSSAIDTFQVSVDDGNGGVDTTTIFILANPSNYNGNISCPIAMLGTTGANNVCVGSNITLSNATIIPAGGSATWSSSGGVNIDSVTGLITGTSAGATIIKYKVKLSAFCQKDTSFKLAVNVSPVVGVSSISSATLCATGATTNVYNTNTNGGGVWSSSNPSVATVTTVFGATGVVTAISNGTSTLTYTKTASNGCQSLATTVVTVSQAAVPNSISGNNNVCVGNTTALSTTSTGGSWSTPSTSIANVNASTGVVTGIYKGTAIISYKITNGVCSSTTNYSVVVSPTPVIPTIQYALGITPNPQRGAGGAFCVGDAFSLVGSPVGGVWSSTAPSVVTMNASSGLMNILSAGSATIKYTITTAFGCSNSRSVALTVAATCPLHRGTVINNGQLTIDNDFTIYPNPARTSINLNVKTLIGSGSIVVTDLYGKQVKTQALSIGNNTVDVSNLAKGFYLVSMITSEEKTTKKLVVE